MVSYHWPTSAMPLHAKQNIQGIPTKMGLWTLQAFHLITKRFNDFSKRIISEVSHKNHANFLVLYNSVSYFFILIQNSDFFSLIPSVCSSFFMWSQTFSASWPLLGSMSTVCPSVTPCYQACFLLSWNSWGEGDRADWLESSCMSEAERHFLKYGDWSQYLPNLMLVNHDVAQCQ